MSSRVTSSGRNSIDQTNERQNTRQLESIRGSLTLGDETVTVEQLPSNDNVQSSLVSEPQLSPNSNLSPTNNQTGDDSINEQGSDNESVVPLPLNNQVVVPLTLQTDAKRSGWNKFARVVLGGLGMLVGAVGGGAAGMAIGGSAGAVGGAVAGVPSGPGAVISALGGAGIGGIVGGGVGAVAGGVVGLRRGAKLADWMFGGRPQEAHLNAAKTSVQQNRGQNFSQDETHNLNQVSNRQWRNLLHVPNKKWFPGNSSRVGSKADRQTIREALVHYVAKNGLDGAADYKKRLITAANSSTPNALQSEVASAGDRVGQTFDRMIDGLAGGASLDEAYGSLEQATKSLMDEAETQGILDDPIRRGRMLTQKMNESVQRFIQRRPNDAGKLRDALGPNGHLAIINDAGEQLTNLTRRRLQSHGAKQQTYSAQFRQSMASALHNEDNDQKVDLGQMQESQSNVRKSEALQRRMIAALPPHQHEHLEAKTPMGFIVDKDGRVGGQSDVGYSAQGPNEPAIRMREKVAQRASKYLADEHLDDVGGIKFSRYAKVDLPRMHVQVTPSNDEKINAEPYDTYGKEADEISQKLKKLTGNGQATKVLSGMLNQRALMPLTTNFVDNQNKNVQPVFAASRAPATVMNNNGDIDDVGSPKHYAACRMNVSKTLQGNYQIDVEWPMYVNGFKYVDQQTGMEDKTAFPLHGDKDHTNPAIKMTIKTTYEIDGDAANRGELNLRMVRPLNASFSGRLGPKPDN